MVTSPWGGASFFITGFTLDYSELSDGAPTTSIIGTEVRPEKSFEISVSQLSTDPPIASGVVTLSDKGETIGVVKWQFSGEMEPNTITTEAFKGWNASTPTVPPHGEMGAVTVTFT